MATKPRIYCDAPGFIDLAKAEVGKKPTATEQDLWTLRKLLEAARDGAVEIFVSTLMIAECTHAEGDTSEKVRDLFVRLLSSGQYTKLVQPDPFVCERARDLLWTHGIKLSGADAVHVASALEVGCTEFLTTDRRRKSPIAQAAKLQPLGLRVIPPRDTALLPDEYRQERFQGIPAAPRPVAKKPRKRRRK